jgi:hypothetical protein
MTGNSNIFSSWNQSSQKIVTIANGSSQSVLGKETTNVLLDVSLSSVLFVPKFSSGFSQQIHKALRLSYYIFCSLLTLSGSKDKENDWWRS